MPAVEVQFGEALFVVALRGDAQGIGDLRGGHAVVGHVERVRGDAQFFAGKASGAADGAGVRQGADVVHQGLRGFFEKARVVAGERDDVAGFAAVAEADAEARAGNVFQAAVDFLFDMGLVRTAATRRKDNVQAGAVARFTADTADDPRLLADGAEDVFDAVNVGDGAAHLLADGEGVMQDGIGGELDGDARLVHVIIRHEGAGQVARPAERDGEEDDGERERRPAPA